MITRQEDGTWEAKIEFGGEIHSETFPNKHQAGRWERAKWKELKGQSETAPSNTPTLAYALRYAALGLRVFPVHSIGPDGKCTCSNAACERPGKHPRTQHGLKDATTDEKQIREWWTK